MPKISIVELLFHHIYSPGKRKAIASWALRDAVPVHAVMRTGKPGRLLAVGRPEHVRQYILLVKGLRWQSVRVESTREPEVDDLSAFDQPSFREVETAKDYRDAKLGLLSSVEA